MDAVIAQELVDQIIDHLYDEPQTLSACSLVCRDWLPSCRFHKFSRITLGTINKGIQKYLEICLVAAPFIKELTLCGSHGDTLRFGDIGKCVNVRQLKLIDITVPISWIIPSALPFPKVEELHVLQCKLDNFPHLAHLLCNFPLLASVTTRACHVFLHEISTADFPSSPPLTGDLIIDETGGRRPLRMVFESTSFFHLLPTLPGGVQFKSIRLKTSNLPVNRLNVLLKACGSSLESLDISESYIFPTSSESISNDFHHVEKN